MLTAKWKSLCTATSALAMMGCVASMPPSTGRTPPDASLLEPCPPLNPLSKGDGESVYRWALATVDEYRDCAARHQRLGEAVR